MTRQRSLTYKVWHAMHKRCTDPSYSNYPLYGARGIKVCARWGSFDTFLQDMGLKPDGMHLDRINNDGDYEPTNCRWVSPAQNTRNRRITRNLTAYGKTQCLADWAKDAGLSAQALSKRLDLGWSLEEAISAPVQTAKARNRAKLFTDRAVAWIRRHPDGTLTGEVLLDSQMEEVRKNCGAWVPLVCADLVERSKDARIRELQAELEQLRQAA